MTGSSDERQPRRPGLQSKWKEVVDSLEAIIPIYEKGSSRISLFADRAMRDDVASFAVGGEKGAVVLDLGSGPGTLSRVVAHAGGVPVLADASRKMLARSPEFDRVQCVFEHLPFRQAASGRRWRGSRSGTPRTSRLALAEIRQTIRTGGRFAFCDLGKPESRLKAALVGAYILVAPPLIGLLTGGPTGLRFGSLFGTYKLVLDNPSLKRLLLTRFSQVEIEARQMGGSIVARCGA